MREPKTVYYRDELTDEFSTAQITPKTIDGSYDYEPRSFFSRVARFVCYRLLAIPFAFLYAKLKFRQKTVGKDALRAFRHTGFFIYGNHTQDVGDPLIPNVFLFPKDVFFLVHPNNVSMPVLGRITPLLGALPLPDGLAAYRNFLTCLQHKIEQNCVVAVYPEAHIWPYYTGIRNFPDASFFYPVKFSCPVFCFTNTYRKRRFSHTPRIVTYVDGPFWPDETLAAKQRAKDLRDRVYETMCERAKNSDVEVIRYVKKED